MVSCAALWWLAVPRHDVCFAIRPAPAGCRIADGVALAAAGTVGLVLLWGGPRRRAGGRAPAETARGGSHRGARLADLLAYRVIRDGIG